MSEISDSEPDSASIATVSIPSRPGKTYQYKRAYIKFKDWAKQQQLTGLTENVLLAYFVHLSKKLKSTSLQAQFYMLKVELLIRENINLDCYKRVQAFTKLKTKNDDKKSKTFTKDQIDTFLREAPDKKYLAMKVVLIYGIAGACRCHELVNMRLQDIEHMEKLILFKIRGTQTCKPRTCIILGEFYMNFCKNYMSLRPEGYKTDRFFIRYLKGVCHKAVMGTHKIASIAKEVAMFLRLADANEYTGQCFRRTSLTLFAKNGGDLWWSATVARGQNSLNDTAVKIKKTTKHSRKGVISIKTQQTVNIDHKVKNQGFKLQDCTIKTLSSSGRITKKKMCRCCT